MSEPSQPNPYAAIFMASHEACAILDEAGRIREANQALAEMLGSEPHALSGIDFASFYSDAHDADGAAWRLGEVGVEETILKDAAGQGFPAQVEALCGHAVLVRDLATDAARLNASTSRSDPAQRESAYLLDLQTQQGIVSGRLAEILGVCEDGHRIHKARWLDAVHPEDRTLPHDRLANAKAGDAGVDDFTCRMQDADGRWRHVRFASRVSAWGEDGKPLKLVGIAQDVTDAEEFAIAAREGEARLQLAISAATLGAWEYDFATETGFSSGPCNAVFGFGPDPVPLDPAVWRSRMHPDDAERVYSAFMGLQFGGAFDETFRMRNEEGDWVWHHSFGERLPPRPDERAPRAAGYGRDVTERMTLSEALSHRDALMREAIDAARLSAWTTDYRTGEVRISGAFNILLGFGGEESAIPFERWREHIHPDDIGAMYDAVDQLERGELVETSYRMRCADGAYRWFLLQGRVNVQDSEGRPVRAAGFISDVNENREMKAELETTRAMIDWASQADTLGFWEMDFTTGLHTVTGGLARALYGEDHRTLTAEAWVDEIHPDERGEALSRTAQVLSGTFEHPETVFRYWSPRLGDWRRIRVTGQVVEYSEDGAPMRLAGISVDITETEALRDQLDLRDRQLRTAVDAGSHGVWEMALQDDEVRVIGRVASLLGLAEGEEMAKSGPWISRMHKDDRPAFITAYERMITGESDTIDVTYRLHTAQGEWVWLNASGRVSNPGAPLAERRISGILKDITERETLRAELAERERNLADAVEAGLIGVWLIDHANRSQSVRGQVLRWMGHGLTEMDVTLDDWSEIIHPADLEMARDALGAINRGEPTPQIEYRLKGPDGWRWARVYGRPVGFSPEGAVTRSAGVIIDITTERRFAEALRAETRRLDAIYRKTPAMMHSISPEGEVLQVSEHWLKVMGYARSEVIGRNSAQFLNPQSAERSRLEVLPQFWRDGSCTDEPYEMVTKNGEVIDVLLSGVVEYDSAGKPLIAHAVIVDVTARRRAERELLRYADELERTNRELDRFATVASHDLQEPLRKISAFASLLRRRYTGAIDPEADRSLEFLVDAAGRMRRLIDDLLSYSRASSRELERETVSLTAMVDEVLQGLDITIGETGAEIRVGPLPAVQGDPTLLRLLFQNLISNAVKYRKAENPKVRLSAHRDERVWRFTVTDDGIGLDPIFADKIFAPFQRLHGRDTYEGTGIGLAICQQAVERHGGEIWVESELGNGARFHFTLPLDAIVADGAVA
ncbi:MAG: PAS domain-containing protein [Pseudomonadota bacterium]